MSKEISEEAKRALADLPRRKALQRLRRDGAESRPAMRRRIRALAAERSIPPADFRKLMYKRPSTQAFMDFCNKHNVSADWLLCGDLKWLQRMTKEAKAGHPVTSETAAEQVKRIVEMCDRMTPENRQLIEKVVDGLLKMNTPDDPA